ncbi:glyceraldehyde 3-phosphate dehydrogenase NAD-binding domain-containing protein [Nonomuraea sp. NPDC049400]|uniref:glyceraldehyde 3-phosphate dehydrogenase NAD-binding domain-containing protein n=1 Tax=Nonomuraea sp. NPDC049400 TaxID=3364352 RepID=UPI0037B277B1
MRIGINGFGRSGRAVLRRELRAGLDTDLDIVAVNDMTGADALAHLLKHDSTYGPLGLPDSASPGALEANGKTVAVLRYSTDPLISRDIVGDAASCVFDSAPNQASGDLVKVFGWYDNEWGYANRLVDMAQRMV